MTVGIKYDQEKPDYSLLPYGALDDVVKVLTYGAKKYDRDNWKYVDDYRYKAAAMRHFSAYMQGEHLDPESNIHHLAHMACSVLFLLQKELDSVDNSSKVCYNNETTTITYKD